MSIKISHETPLCLLEESLTFNDYNFCLPYYYTRYPKYKEWFVKQKEQGIFTILDCGLFEGELLSNRDLVNIINELKPDVFVIPDVWNKDLDSYVNAKYWKNTLKSSFNKTTELMAVIQCTDYNIGSLLYQKYLDLGIKHIAFNHSSIAYKNMFPHENLSISKTMGRIYFINQLMENGIIDKSVYHHLLGASNPLEFKSYNYPSYDFIKSVDSSNPVIFGCKNMKYDIYNVWDKPHEKIEEWFDKELSLEQLTCITYNIHAFRKLIS